MTEQRDKCDLSGILMLYVMLRPSDWICKKMLPKPVLRSPFQGEYPPSFFLVPSSTCCPWSQLQRPSRGPCRAVTLRPSEAQGPGAAAWGGEAPTQHQPHLPATHNRSLELLPCRSQQRGGLGWGRTNLPLPQN